MYTSIKLWVKMYTFIIVPPEVHHIMAYVADLEDNGEKKGEEHRPFIGGYFILLNITQAFFF